MQTWRKEIGTVGLSYGVVRIVGDAAQLRTWARMPGAAWPCSVLATRERVCAELDRNGELIDLQEACDSGAFADEIPGDELTAWIDDNLAGTPFAHLARTVQA